MSWKNRLIKAVLWVFNPEATRPKHPKQPSRFLIVSTTGLGDTLWATPALRTLRSSFPDGEISILTSSVGAAALKHNSQIDEVFVLEKSLFFSLLRFFFPMRRRKFDAILVFHTSQRMVLPFCALLEAPILIGTAGINKDLDFLFTKALPSKYQHEIARRLDIVKELGAHVSDFHMEMPITKEEETYIDSFLDGHGIAGHIPIVGLHPGAKNTFKQWPKEHFVEVGNRLTQHLGCQILVTGDQSEALLAYEIASKIPGAIPIAGELDLSNFATLLKRMMVFVTCDTGPMHMAYAVKTPTVAIFGPTDPNLCGPYHLDNVEVLSVKKTCAPCLKKRCNSPFCLYAIGPNQVVDAALSCLPLMETSWKN